MNLVHFHATVLKISWVTVVKSYEVRFVFKQILLVTYVKEVEIFPRGTSCQNGRMILVSWPTGCGLTEAGWKNFFSNLQS